MPRWTHWILPYIELGKEPPYSSYIRNLLIFVWDFAADKSGILVVRPCSSDGNALEGNGYAWFCFLMFIICKEEMYVH
ncbi:hypothetical protein QYF36_025027 [Acer negundo]|nr:hypothetical protein QYF36_025027 [Acer negundo]